MVVSSVLVDGSNRTRQFGNSSTRACSSSSSYLREMLLAGRAPCLDMSPLLTPTDKLEPCPAAAGDGWSRAAGRMHGSWMMDACTRISLTDTNG